MTVIISGLDQRGDPYSLACAMTGPEALLCPGAEWGDVRGDVGVIAGLKADEGEMVGLTPTGPWVALAPNDHHSILGWLADQTQILDVEGDPGPDSRMPEDPPEFDY